MSLHQCIRRIILGVLTKVVFRIGIYQKFIVTLDSDQIQSMHTVHRERQRRRSLDESPEQRMNRFVILQTESFEILSSSPAGLRNFHSRNHRSRRVEVVDGVWHPVSVDRRFAFA